MYELYYRLDKTDKKPIKIKIEDYISDGEIEAGTRGEALRKWYLGDVKHAESIRNPEIGDMIKDPTGKYFLLTISGVWSLITLTLE